MRSEKVYFKIKNLAFLGALNWCIICCASALSSCLSLDDVLTRSRSSCVVALVTKNCIADQDVDNYGYVQLRNLFQHKNLGIVFTLIASGQTENPFVREMLRLETLFCFEK